MMTVEMRVGRFIEIRGSGVVTVAEMTTFRSGLFALMVKANGPILACVDMRALQPFDDAVKGMFVGLMRGDNPHVERSAHISIPGAPYHQQAKEMIAAARNPSRRLFDAPRELAAWLAEVMTREEAARLDAFLAGSPGT